jgi:hypothetical protein
VLDYTPRGARGYELVLTSKGGLQVQLVAVQDKEPAAKGSVELLANVAFMASMTSYGSNELARRRARAVEKRKSHAKEAKKAAEDAQAIANMVDRLGERTASGWCSGCFELTTHRQVRGHDRPARKYLCENCGTPTTRCAVPRCGHFAVVKPSAWHTTRYCAEHRHEIPSFEKLTSRLGTLDEYEEWLRFERRNAARVTAVTGGTLAVGAVVAPMAFLCAPAVGAALGSSFLGGGLSGAAATSHGLAMLGGGAVATGGLGMAGGTVVVTATGTAVGGALGATATSAYTSADKSFRIEKLRDGQGPAVLLASGFLTETSDGWGAWRMMIDQRYPLSPVYRVHWGAKELKDLGFLLGAGSAKVAARKVLADGAAKGSKSFGRLAGLGWVLAAHDVAANPWTVAKNRAGMTGAALAGLLARTDKQRFILVGHSLGARVMVTCAQQLGTLPEEPRIESMHLLGAAVGAKGDWRSLDAAVAGTVWNYWSGKDAVLKWLYSLAEAGQTAVGQRGFSSKFARIRDRNVTAIVGGHSAYFDEVKLQPSSV